MAVPASGRIQSREKTVPEEVPAPEQERTVSTPVRLGRTALAVLVLLCGVTLVLGFANKNRCTGPSFDSQGRSVGAIDYEQRNRQDVCYSDIQHLWLGRDINKHVFPYVHGSLGPDGKLVGGVVEDPVLTGLMVWFSAKFASNDAEFLLASAILLAP